MLLKTFICTCLVPPPTQIPNKLPIFRDSLLKDKAKVFKLCIQTLCQQVMCDDVNAYAIGCGVLATIEQWYPTRKFNGTMVPHKRNSIVWPHLVTRQSSTPQVPCVGLCAHVCEKQT